MRPAIVVVGALAFTAAAGTYVALNHYLDTVGGRGSAPPTMDILVAAAPIPTGKTIDATVLEWHRWPEAVAKEAAGHGALVSDDKGRTAAQKAYEGTVARTSILKGEPLTDDKVAHAGSGSVLSMVLAAGTRSMTLPVNAVVGAGGMVQPGDRVDLLMTRDLKEVAAVGAETRDTKPKPSVVGETIMDDLKVVAVDRHVAAAADASGPVPTNVTFEVTPEQAEKLVIAAQLGHFALAMRPLAVGPDPVRHGLRMATDLSLMPNMEAARLGTTPDRLSPDANPFYTPPPPRVVPKPVNDILVYRWTTPSVVKVIDGKVVPEKQEAPTAGAVPTARGTDVADAPQGEPQPQAAPGHRIGDPVDGSPHPAKAPDAGDDPDGGYYGARPINKAAAAHIGVSGKGLP